MLVLDKLKEYVKDNKDDIVSDLRSLIKHPSVSAQGIGIDECAGTLNSIMRDAGLESRIIRIEDGNPIVYGEVKGKRGSKTILFYSHYDVQPAEPLDAWRYNPFSGIVTDDKIYGRGSADSKGNVIAIVKAIKAILELYDELPVNVKVLIEGEEEISSINLPAFVEKNKDMLNADACVCFDGSLNPSGSPNIFAGLKGLLYVELRCKTAMIDMHSSLAPLVHNAAWVLVKALNSIKKDGKIAIPNWYDDVKVPSKKDLDLLDGIDYDLESIKSSYGIKEFIGDVKGKAALKRLLFEPTCNIAGIYSGYVAGGSKTVLPSEAYAKIDFRLVYDQNPDTLLNKLKKYLKEEGYDNIDVIKLGSLEPSKTDSSESIVRCTQDAARKVYGKEPTLFPNSWASGPDYVFTKILKIPSVWTGCSPANANIHAPNEFTSISNVLDGICYVSSIMHEFSMYK